MHYEKIGNKTTCIEDIIPFEIPNSWSWVRLGFLFSHNTGKALNAKNTAGNMLAYITTSNLYWNRFEFGELKSMPFTDDEVEKCTVKKGDLLVCEGGDIGRAAIWNYNFPIRIQNHIHRLRTYSNIEMLFYYFVLFFYKFTGRIGGKGIGIQGLSSNALHSIIVPLPPKEEQSIIVNKLTVISAIIDSAEKEQNNLQAIINQVKTKILDLAIRGKLVPQDSKDEPASVLLERIRAEKKAKLGKKYVDNYIYQGDDKSYYQTLENSVVKIDIPLIIPDTWSWYIIDKIFDIKNGFTPLRTNKEFWTNGTVPWFTISDMREQGQIISKTQQKIATIATSLDRIVEPNSVLICCTASIGATAMNTISLTTNQQFNAISCKSDYKTIVDMKYVFYYIGTLKGYLNSIAGATTFGFVSVSKLGKIGLPLPPFVEQQRIVTAIETAFKQLDKISKALS